MHVSPPTPHSRAPHAPHLPTHPCPPTHPPTVIPPSRPSQVERLLSGVDAVVYLLDYTKLKTAEEAAIFRRLREVNPTLVQRLASRLFFVVNKARG